MEKQFQPPHGDNWNVITALQTTPGGCQTNYQEDNTEQVSLSDTDIDPHRALPGFLTLKILMLMK